MRLKTGTDYSLLLPFIAISLVLLGVDFLGWLSGFRAVSERIINPISGGIRVVGQATLEPFATLRFALSGHERVTDLESRYAEALVKAEQVEQLSKENESLRTLLGSGTLSDYNYEPVKTISLDGSELVLSIGSTRGLRGGETVVDENHVLVGRVTKVSSWTSWITRVIDAHSRVPVVIGTSKASGLLVGIGSGKAMVEVEQADQVSVGDSVFTSGTNGDYVSGILVGRVVEVENESASVYKKVLIDPLATLSQIVYLVQGKEI